MSLYNRYIPGDASYAPVSAQEEEAAIRRSAAPLPESSPRPAAKEEPADERKSDGLASLLKLLKLEELDTGDILLLLIMLFLFLEGDDMELVITLGLILVLSL
jgi:hypothetical protein